MKRKRASTAGYLAEDAPADRPLASPPCALHEFAEWAAAEQPNASLIRLKRAYVPPAADDGPRFLVDRLWPRGIKREALCLTAWLKDAAPSPSLRQWFAHDPARWPEFRQRYWQELQSNLDALQPLREALTRGSLTLVYGARDETHNHALVLREFLLSLLERKESPPEK